MNSYYKYLPNVYLAKCEEKHEKYEIIEIETKYWKINEHIIHNLIAEKWWFYYYSITRNDWMNSQEFAKKKIEKLNNASVNAENKSTDYWKRSNEWSEFLSLAEPIKIWHHSEWRHRALMERNHKRMEKSIEYSNKASEYTDRVWYWEDKSTKIDLSMPESIEYYEYKLEQATLKHKWLKDWTIKKSHSYSLTYAKKESNEALKNLEYAKKLWE